MTWQHNSRRSWTRQTGQRHALDSQLVVTACHDAICRALVILHVAITNPQLQMYDAHRALDIKISELRQDFGGSDDVPAQLLHSLAGVCDSFHAVLVADVLITAAAPQLPAGVMAAVPAKPRSCTLSQAVYFLNF